MSGKPAPTVPPAASVYLEQLLGLPGSGLVTEPSSLASVS